MNKKVLIISSSPRKGGNSETLAAAFAKDAPETFAGDRKSTRLNSSHYQQSRMPSSA